MTKWVSFVLAAIAMVFVLNASAHDRYFYLTRTTHQGNKVLTACADGYHFASLSELHYYGSLVYNTELGHINSDSGFGAPGNTFGWMRTGLQGVGVVCDLWTTSNELSEGTQVSLSIDSGGNPWRTLLESCSTALPVWCVSDPVEPVVSEVISCDGFESCPTP